MNKDEIFHQFAQYFAQAVQVIVDDAVTKALKNVNIGNSTELEEKIQSLEEQVQNVDEWTSEIASTIDDYHSVKEDVQNIKETLEEHDLDEASSYAREAKDEVDSLSIDVESLQESVSELTDSEKFAEKVREALISIASKKEEENV